jgi:hypothetical protein
MNKSSDNSIFVLAEKTSGKYWTGKHFVNTLNYEGLTKNIKNSVMFKTKSKAEKIIKGDSWFRRLDYDFEIKEVKLIIQ